MLRIAIKNLSRVIATALIFCSVAPLAYATTIASDDFESYSNGANLNGANGGTGWSGAWSVTNGDNYTAANTVVHGGSLAAKYTAAAADDNSIQRSFTGQTSGIFDFYTYKTSTTQEQWSFRVFSGATLLTLGYFNTSGNITSFDNLTENNLQAYSANTWYHVQVKVDCAIDKYYVAIDEGAYTSAYTMYNGATCTTFDKIQIIKQNAIGDVNAYFDDVLITDIPGAATAPFMPFIMYFFGHW